MKPLGGAAASEGKEGAVWGVRDRLIVPLPHVLCWTPRFQDPRGCWHPELSEMRSLQVKLVKLRASWSGVSPRPT